MKAEKKGWTTLNFNGVMQFSCPKKCSRLRATWNRTMTRPIFIFYIDVSRVALSSVVNTQPEKHSPLHGLKRAPFNFHNGRASYWKYAIFLGCFLHLQKVWREKYWFWFEQFVFYTFWPTMSHQFYFDKMLNAQFYWTNAYEWYIW